jgi:sugar-specific transcriptional regulator TrmB
VSSIARRAGENRVTTYSILKDLSLRGISNEVIKNSKKYYSVISPEKLVKRQEEKFTKIKNALPELMAITSEYAHKPKIFYYEGSTGIIEIFK